MSESFISYRSFHDALKDLPMDQYGKIMYAIHEYALNQTEIELSGIEKMAFTLIKPQLDANIRRQEAGHLGGRPKKENNSDETEKPMVSDNTETEKPMVIFSDEKEKPNKNYNDNENKNLNENEEDDDAVTKDPPAVKADEIPPSSSSLSDSQKNYSRIIFEKFKNAGLPCQKGDFFRFQSCDFRLALQKLKGFPSQDVISAVDNYIAELRKADSYINKEFSFDAFVASKTFSNCLPANYRPNNFKKFQKDVPKGAETNANKAFKCDKCGQMTATWSAKLMQWHCAACGANFD